MSKLLSAFLIVTTSIAFAPNSSASGWGNWGGWGGWGNNSHDNDCKDKNDKPKHDKDCKDKNKNKHDKDCNDNNKDCKNKKHGKHCKKSCKKKDNNGGGNNCNPPKLVCDAGGPYLIDSVAPFSFVELDGRDSSGETAYLWTTNYPGAMFDDPTSGTPTLTIPSGSCNFDLTVYLTVSNNKGSSTCNASVRLCDAEPPVITCPENQKFFCGTDESPATQGCATAVDNCDNDVSITYKDTITGPSCVADRFDHIVHRRWKARDDAGNYSQCTQTLDVIKVLTFLDVLPGVCPNEINQCSSALVPVAIVGTPGFNVGNVQWNTVRLYGRDCVGGPVTPQTLQLADVTGPFYATQECECGVVAPDGTLDLVAYFHPGVLAQRFGFDCLPAGSVVPVVMTGRLADGCRFVATDCMIRL